MASMYSAIRRSMETPGLPQPDPNQPLRTVLVVEDEPTTMRFYGTGLKGLQASGWRILTAMNGALAAEVLKVEPVDVVVTDLQMPVMDGYRLIAHIHERYPTLPVIVITSIPLIESRERALQLGALRVMPKPTRLSYLMEEIRQAGDLKPEGMVRGLGLGSLLQLMQWEGRTATFQVRSQGRLGHLYLRQGQLVHAEAMGQEGLPAAYQILLWERPEVTFVDACRVSTCTIDLPIPEVLMNVALIQDQSRPDAPVELPPVARNPWGGDL